MVSDESSTRFALPGPCEFMSVARRLGVLGMRRGIKAENFALRLRYRYFLQFGLRSVSVSVFADT